MGACNFGGAEIGCVAVGMDRTYVWTDEDRADYREMVGDESLTDDDVDNCLWENEDEYISVMGNLSLRFAEDLQSFVHCRFFEHLQEGEIPLIVGVDCGYNSGFEMRTKDALGFCRDQARFLEAQVAGWTGYSLNNKAFTPEEWCKHVEKALDFIDYALVRFAYSKVLSLVNGGWTGGVRPINAENVREYARFEQYGAELTLIWWGFCQKYGKEYNHIGL